MSTKKKLVGIPPRDAAVGGVIELQFFQDGSIQRADALVGVDGISGSAKVLTREPMLLLRSRYLRAGGTVGI